jgi:uncharacterized protein YbjQ (UPF0145 family)
MLVVTSPDIPGKKIVKTLGIVKGNTIRARHIGKDILAAFKNIVGGEIQEYTKLMAESREQAIDRMIESAEQMGANAIISTNTTTSVISQGAAELLVLGTAEKEVFLLTSLSFSSCIYS